MFKTFAANIQIKKNFNYMLLELKLQAIFVDEIIFCFNAFHIVLKLLTE